ncbi:MAG: hypothetical protein V1912_00960 [bacterium]
MKSSISIALFFLLSGFFLSTLLGAVEHSRKLLGIAAACLVAVACVIVFLTPVQLPPSWRLGSKQGGTDSTASTTAGAAAGTTVTTTVTTTVNTTVSITSITVGPAVTLTRGLTTGSSVTTGAFGARSR